MRSWLNLFVVLLLAAGLSACGSAPKRAYTGDLPPPDTTSASGAYEGATDYRVGAQDLLQISVFGVQELSHQARRAKVRGIRCRSQAIKLQHSSRQNKKQ